MTLLTHALAAPLAINNRTIWAQCRRKAITETAVNTAGANVIAVAERIWLCLQRRWQRVVTSPIRLTAHLPLDRSCSEQRQKDAVEETGPCSAPS